MYKPIDAYNKKPEAIKADGFGFFPLLHRHSWVNVDAELVSLCLERRDYHKHRPTLIQSFVPGEATPEQAHGKPFPSVSRAA